MSEKLKLHLARRSVDLLRPLLGDQFVALLTHVGQEALAPVVMADIIVTSRGAASVLRDNLILSMLIDHMDEEDALHLCTALSQSVLMPKPTLRSVDFKRPSFEKTLFEWYGVIYGEGENSEAEPSRRATSQAKLRTFQESAYRQLRHALDVPGNNVLLHMPFGAGKLRTVVTAVLEAFRSRSDDGTILWLAPDACLSEEAMAEIERVWWQLGLRDITAYRLFGGRQFLPLDTVSNAVVVADIQRFSSAVGNEHNAEVASMLTQFGSRTKFVVLADAAQIVLAPIQNILQALRRGGDFVLVGISAAPGLAIENSVTIASLVGAFDGPIIEMDEDEPLAALRDDGETDPIEVHAITSPVTDLEGADDPFDLPEAAALALSMHPERNRTLLDSLLRIAADEERIVFYATTAMQARIFASLMSLKGCPASAVTGEMPVGQQAIAITRFNGDPHMQILCVHGVLVSAENVHKVTALVLGRPTISGALLHETVGRMSSSRRRLTRPLKIYAVRDPVPSFLTLVDNLDSWDRLPVRS